MDSPYDHEPDDKTLPQPPNEADVRAMLEQSRRDIAAGRTAPLPPVLDRMRATAEQIRLQRTKRTGTG
jgi:hypothetical protein